MKNYGIKIIALLSSVLFTVFFGLKNGAYAKSAVLLTGNTKKTSSRGPKENEFDKVLRLKLKIFLGANDLKNAYRVCKEATSRFPSDYRWWERRGRVAIWMGNTPEGVGDYYRAFTLNGNKSLGIKVYKFFVMYHRWDMAEKMLKAVGYSVSLKDKVYVYDMAGNPHRLIKFLKAQYGKRKSKSVLNYLIYTYWGIGDVKDTVRTIKTLKNDFGLNADDAITYADVLLAKMDYGHALSVMKAYRVKAKERNYKFWDKLSDLAWMLGDYKTAVGASTILANLKPERMLINKVWINYRPGRKRDYERIYLYYSKTDPKIAMKYAFLGWKIYRIPYLFDGFIYVAAKQKMWKHIINSVNALSGKDFAYLSSNVYFVLTYADALARTGSVNKAKRLCMKELNRNFNQDFLSELIYLSLSSDEAMLKYIAGRWRNAPLSYPSLVSPFISLYIRLNDGQQALRLSKYLMERPTLDNRLLYADILSLYGDVHEAKGIRYEAWIEIKNRLKVHPRLAYNVQFLEDYLSESTRFDRYKKFKKVLMFSKKVLPAKTFADFRLSSELFRNYRGKTLYLHKKYGYALKPWMLLDIALWSRDTYLQDKLLKEWADILPIRDRVEAFRKTGDIGNAFVYAFKGLEENRADDLLYKQFRDVADKYADRTALSTRYINWDGYREISEDMHLKYHLAGGFSLIPSVKVGKEVSYDEGSIVNVPYKHYNAGLTVEKQYSDCGFKASAGLIVSLASNPYFLIEPECRINDSASLKLLYGEHIEDDETLFLYLGGLKRELKAALYNNVTQRTSFSVSVSQDWYMSQDNVAIGSGNGIYGELDYKLTEAYPDYTLRSFVQSNRYYANGNQGDIARLSPFSNFDALPSSYNLIGAGFTLGSDYKYKLEKTWRPFLHGDVFYETDSGMGYDAGGGYGGSIFGNDNMSIGANYYTNFHGSSSSYLDFFINYNIYF